MRTLRTRSGRDQTKRAKQPRLEDFDRLALGFQELDQSRDSLFVVGHPKPEMLQVLAKARCEPRYGSDFGGEFRRFEPVARCRRLERGHSRTQGDQLVLDVDVRDQGTETLDLPLRPLEARQQALVSEPQVVQRGRALRIAHRRRAWPLSCQLLERFLHPGDPRLESRHRLTEVERATLFPRDTRRRNRFGSRRFGAGCVRACRHPGRWRCRIRRRLAGLPFPIVAVNLRDRRQVIELDAVRCVEAKRGALVQGIDVVAAEGVGIRLEQGEHHALRTDRRLRPELEGNQPQGIGPANRAVAPCVRGRRRGEQGQRQRREGVPRIANQDPALETLADPKLNREPGESRRGRNESRNGPRNGLPSVPIAVSCSMIRPAPRPGRNPQCSGTPPRGCPHRRRSTPIPTRCP